jgi:hypothetical protein
LAKHTGGATEKLDGWAPQPRPEEEKCAAIRQLVKEAVFQLWEKNKKPAHLREIWRVVNHKIHEQRTLGLFPWKPPSKRTVDRRVNEAASEAFADDGVPKIVAVSAGYYQPNPEVFEA